MSELPRPPRGFIHVHEALDRVEPLLKAGLSNEEIAERTGFKANAVRLLRMKWKSGRTQ